MASRCPLTVVAIHRSARVSETNPNPLMTAHQTGLNPLRPSGPWQQHPSDLPLTITRRKISATPTADYLTRTWLFPVVACLSFPGRSLRMWERVVSSRTTSVRTANTSALVKKRMSRFHRTTKTAVERKPLGH